jgi:Zn-dependent peptidase ImmA (M78 family)
MKLLIEKIFRLSIDWNKRPLNENDFYRLCKKHKVAVEEIPLRVSGFYYSVLGKHCIAIDSKLPPQKKLFVMFHEFAHFLLHAPEGTATANYHGVGRRTRKETEADAFALCALVPRNWIETRTLAEMIEHDGISEEILKDRFGIYEKHGL